MHAHLHHTHTHVHDPCQLLYEQHMHTGLAIHLDACTHTFTIQRRQLQIQATHPNLKKHSSVAYINLNARGTC